MGRRLGRRRRLKRGQQSNWPSSSSEQVKPTPTPGPEEKGEEMPRKHKKWEPGETLSISTTLPPGLAKRFIRYCEETERSNSGAMRLFIKRILSREDY